MPSSRRPSASLICRDRAPDSNNPVGESAIETSFLGPFYAEYAKQSRSLAFLHCPISLALPPVEHGGSIASKGGGEHMYVEGRVLTTKSEPIAGAIIDI